jgi:predicted nucleic acid-binding protein
MTAKVFVDTNVLVYWRDAGDPEKQSRALAWLELLWERRTGRLSFQVLQEFYVTVTAKLDPGLSPELARLNVRQLLVWKPVAVDDRLLEEAWLLQDRFRLPWRDSLIVAAARFGDCRYLLSEDFQEGMEFGGLRVVNPFLNRPEDFK